MSMFFRVVGFGNYSNDYGWDDGIDFNEPVFVTPAEIEATNDLCDGVEGCYTINTDRSKCEDVQTEFLNEHGGSRNITLVVKAMGYAQAAEKAKEWAEVMYPCRGY